MSRPSGRLGQGLGRLQRVRSRSAPTWALGLAVALASWLTSFNPLFVGLDASWGSGLYMATHDGLNFGSAMIFTYGPLGFLFAAIGWYTGLATISFVWNAALHIALAVGLIWILRRTYGALVAVVACFIVLCLLIPLDVAFVLAAILCLAALSPQRPRFALEALIVIGASFAAVEVLVKLSVGPPVLAMFIVALIGARAGGRRLAAFLVLFAVEVVGLWLASGQALGDLPDYVSGGREIITGYSEAMSVATGSPSLQRILLAAAILTLLALVVAASRGSYRDERARWAAIGLVAIGAFSLFKEGVVRFDAPHLAVYFSSAAVLWLLLPWSRRSLPVALVGAVALIGGAVTLAYKDVPAKAVVKNLDAVANVKRAFEQGRLLLDPGRRANETAFGLALLKVGYAVPERMLANLAGHTVSIDPWEIAVAWSDGLDWQPLPVFQNYSAYTAELDRINADAVASPDGPERILRHNPEKVVGLPPTRTIDGRFPGWDPPAQTLATICHFEPLRTTSRWQLLGRVPDRCGEPRQVGSVTAADGDTVTVPRAAPGEVVFGRIEGAGVDGLEWVRSLLYRARFRFATVNGDERYRLVPGTAADGLLLRGSSRLTGSGAFAQSPQARTIEVTGAGGELRYDFYSMAVDDRSAKAQGSGRG